MIVRCASCQTEFSLDDRQVGQGGASVRCSVCGHVFKVEGRVDPNNEQPWQIRTTDDLLFTASDLITLRNWILEGRLHPDDRVSRTGRNFLRLGDMPEFADAFAGFPELPPLIAAEEKGPSEISALNLLGPPPAFGTNSEAGVAAPLSGVPESTADAPSSIGLLSDLVQRTATSAEYDTVAKLVPEEVEATKVRAAPTRAPSEASPPRPPPPRRDTAGPRVGVPSTIHDDRSSRPASMLDAVTAHVRPIPSPVVEVRSRPATTIEAPVRAREPVVVEPRRRSSWPLWAALGTLGGAAVVFGVPSVREKLLGATPTASASASADHSAVVQQAETALASAEPQALARADAALQTAIATSPGTDVDQLRVLECEVLATRAIVHELWGAIEPTMRSDAWFWAQDDAVRAAALLQTLGASADATRRARADTLVRVVQRRIDPTQAVANEEERLLLAAAPLLRDDKVKLPPDVLAGLAALPSASVPTRLLLALAQHRAGDDEAARATTTAVLAAAPDQPAARALARQLSVKIADAGEPEHVVEPAPVPEPVPTEAKTDPVPTPDAKSVVAPKPGVPEESAARLIDRGCSKVESGAAAEAVPLLKRALEKRPGDLDALLCLGNAHAAQGDHGNALRFYQRAIDRSPNMLSALNGAARSAAKLGRKEQAVRLYKRLLEHDPGHDAAREYVKANEGGGKPADGGAEAGGAGGGSMG